MTLSWILHDKSHQIFFFGGGGGLRDFTVAFFQYEISWDSISWVCSPSEIQFFVGKKSFYCKFASTICLDYLMNSLYAHVLGTISVSMNCTLWLDIVKRESWLCKGNDRNIEPRSHDTWYRSVQYCVAMCILLHSISIIADQISVFDRSTAQCCKQHDIEVY